MNVGVLGGGQLGRMLALAGYPLGLRLRFLDPSPDAPAGQVGELVAGSYDDEDVLGRFAEGLDVVTYEFENVPVAPVRALARRLPVRPCPEALEAGQDRLREKRLFERLGISTAPFVPVDSETALGDAVRKIGLPAVLKTRRLGYDGRGQVVLRRSADGAGAWAQLGGAPAILEGFVPFERELSILAVRRQGGEIACYPLVQNHHRDGILRLSLAPAPGLTGALQARAERYARLIFETVDYIGVLAVELFQAGDELLANEMAPRVHNSGHWTIEGAETSQFENHLRAVTGLPLGSTAPRAYVAMLNLIGTTPDPSAVLAVPGAHLHLYGKTPRPRRKLGHITVTAADQPTLDARLEPLRRLADA